MATTAGALSKILNTDTKAVLQSAAATAGTAPYTYQWYRSTVTGFTPGAGNLISGATDLNLTDTGLTPGETYFYVVRATDDSATPVSDDSTELEVTMDQANPGQNQFAQAAYLGMTDLRMNNNTIAVMFDPAGSGTLTSGQAVKWSTNSSKLPLVVPATAKADVVAGFVNFNMKDVQYAAGDVLEISLAGNVMFLRAVGAIDRGEEVTSFPEAVAGGIDGGVEAVTGSSGFPIVGYSLDQVASGELVRVMIQSPSGRVDS